MGLTGKNQSYARLINNRMVMRELSRADCSATMLSRELRLSNAALSSIISDLKRDGYIREVACTDNNATQALGRKPVYYSINENFGCVAVVGLSNHRATVALSDMKACITDSVETRVERYDVATIYELVLTLKNLIAKPEYSGVPLLGIDLSVPGRVNEVTGDLILSPQFDKDLFGEKNYMVDLFARQFGVPVKMTNDINLAGYAEMCRGALRDVENGMLVHVDEGIGGALILGGKLYTGSQGFAGEIGIMRTEFDGRIDVLDEFSSMRAVKNKLSDGKEIHTDDVMRLYRSDASAREYINKTADCIGRVLKDVVELLDISTIVVSGRVTGFGDEYFECIQAAVDKSINGARVCPSALDRGASIVGAVSKAVEALTADILENKSNNKSWRNE